MIRPGAFRANQAGKKKNAIPMIRYTANIKKPFQPIRFAVLRDHVHDADGNGDRQDFEHREAQIHRSVRHEVRNEDENRRHEQRDLNARADRNVHGQVHLVLDRDENRRGVLGSIADHRDHDHSDEHLGESQRVGGFFHGAHQKLAHPCHQRGRDEKREGRASWTHVRGDLLVIFGMALAGVEMLVRSQAEDEAQDVDDEQNDGDLERKRALERRLLGERDARPLHRGLRHAVKERGNDEPDRRQGQERRADGSRGAIERLPLALQSAEEERRPQHEKDVADDRAGQACLHDVVVAATQRAQRDDELGRISERRVHEPADSGAEAGGQMLRRFAHDSGQGNDGEAGKQEDEELAPMQELGGHGERNEYEKNLQQILEREERPAGREGSGRIGHGRPGE